MWNTLAAVVTLLVIDFLWLKWNGQRFNRLVHAVQHSDIRLNYTGAVLSYACLLIILLTISFPLAKRLKKEKKMNSIAIALYTGGILGFCSYGVMHMTNLAMFRNYNPWIGAMDMVWGGVLFTLTVWVYLSF